MATAALDLGILENKMTGQDSGGSAQGFRGSRNLLENTLDPDSSLVSRCLRGDEAAWEELVRVHTRKVYGL